MPRALDGRAIITATNAKPSLITAPSRDHQRLRKSVLAAFSSTALKEQEPHIRGFIDTLLEMLGQERGKGPLDIGSFYDWAIFDIISSLALGKSFDSLRHLCCHPWVSDIQESLRYIRWAQPSTFYGVSWIVACLIPRRLLRARKSNQIFTNTLIDDRILRGPSHKQVDFMHYALRKQDDCEVTHDELRNLMSNIIVAGGETTSSLLCGLTCSTPYAKFDDYEANCS
jgi:cytochrome P450